MHLKVQNRNGRAYLSIVQNYRQGGKTRTRTVETIGYADEFADEFDDPIAHFRTYAKRLSEHAADMQQPIAMSFVPESVIAEPAVPPARLGAAIALGCLDALGVGDFFRSRAGRDGFPDHAGRIFEMLAAERMMHATSKRESWTSRNSFPRPCEFSFEDVYAALPCFAREGMHLDASCQRNWANIGDRGPQGRIFLICGSYAFPIDGGSERASIAVALGEDNMPLGYQALMGRLGPQAFRKMADALESRLDARRAVIVAGGLRDLGPTIAELTSQGDGFVLYQRDFHNVESLAAWANDEGGYSPLGGSVYAKWRISERALPTGASLPVKEVVLRGGGYAVRRRHAVLVTSELDLSDAAIVQLYRELWRQAEPFQPLEADFSSVPHPTAVADHIHAHFAICYTAFLGLRLLRWKMGWTHNAADAADALLRMEGIHLQRNYYLFSYRTPVTDSIENATGVPCARRLRTKSELRSIPPAVARAMRGSNDQ